ncbi:hypothetical protein HPP92_012865 [Vanilla planifolia]|uniref:Uncharacterized protein n=1 Tax=Vanilla planifolia TaxID=51239 RepID=A0A835QTV9_VANPL|nr:hypothetical protein HPP92_012865 [Vanilla planifolia]
MTSWSFHKRDITVITPIGRSGAKHRQIALIEEQAGCDSSADVTLISRLPSHQTGGQQQLLGGYFDCAYFCRQFVSMPIVHVVGLIGSKRCGILLLEVDRLFRPGGYFAHPLLKLMLKTRRSQKSEEMSLVERM